MEGEKEYKSAIRIAKSPKAVYYGNLGVLYHRCLKCQLVFFSIDKLLILLMWCVLYQVGGYKEGCEFLQSRP